MANGSFPAVPQALLTALEERFPNRLPPDPEPAEDTARRIGQQDVLRKLRTEYVRQTKNILTQE